jgi:ribosomal protein S14
VTSREFVEGDRWMELFEVSSPEADFCSNSAKRDICVNCLYRFSSCVMNVMHLHYKDHLLNAVEVNNRCLLWASYGAYKRTLKMCRFFFSVNAYGEVR